MRTSVFLGLALLVMVAGMPSPAQSQGLHCQAVSVETCAMAGKLGRGINLGNMLDPPREGDWGYWLLPEYLDKVAPLFTTVRIPVRWSNHAAPTEDAALDERFAGRVDKVIDSYLAKGLYVILDLHHYNQLFGDALMPNEYPVAAEVLETRLVNIWQQLAERYKDRSDKLIFELLNEPHGKLNGEPWNALLARILKTVRSSNPTRTVLLGPTEWNAAKALDKLRLPDDRHLLIAIHNYEPFNFTHQGIQYLPKPFPTGTKCCNKQQQQMITDALDLAQAWSKQHGYPLHIGEFGAYKAANMDARASYIRFVRDEIERRGMGWTYWDFASSFGIFDTKTGIWIDPLRRALLD